MNLDYNYLNEIEIGLDYDDCDDDCEDYFFESLEDETEELLDYYEQKYGCNKIAG